MDWFSAAHGSSREMMDDGGHPVGPWMMDVSTESLWCRFFFNFLDFLGMYLFI